MSSTAQSQRKAPRTDDIEALSIFEFELPSLRMSVELAAIIAESVKVDKVEHPALAFAIDKAPAAVAENLLLRTAELLEIMDRLCLSIGLDGLFEGRGRDLMPKDPVFRLALDLRHERVAHRIKMRGILEPGPAWGHVREAFGTVRAFLLSVLDGLETRLREIRHAGVPVRMPRHAARKLYAPFTAADVSELVKAADQLPAARRKPPTA